MSPHALPHAVLVLAAFAVKCLHQLLAAAAAVAAHERSPSLG